MKIAFDIIGTLKRSSSEETKTMIDFLKILKKAGHFIIVWSGDDRTEIVKFVKENDLTEFVDLMVDKLKIEAKDLPDIAIDDNELIFAKKVVIKV